MSSRLSRRVAWRGCSRSGLRRSTRMPSPSPTGAGRGACGVAVRMSAAPTRSLRSCLARCGSPYRARRPSPACSRSRCPVAVSLRPSPAKTCRSCRACRTWSPRPVPPPRKPPPQALSRWTTRCSRRSARACVTGSRRRRARSSPRCRTSPARIPTPSSPPRSSSSISRSSRPRSWQPVPPRRRPRRQISRASSPSGRRSRSVSRRRP